MTHMEICVDVVNVIKVFQYALSDIMVKTITIRKSDVQKILDEVRTMKIKYCVFCGVSKDTAELQNVICKTRNLLDVKVRKHTFRVKKT